MAFVFLILVFIDFIDCGGYLISIAYCPFFHYVGFVVRRLKCVKELVVFCFYRTMSLGVSAITCFLHACRHQNESKSRKYLAKVLWLLTYDDDKSTLAEAVDKYCVGVPPVQWLPWYVWYRK